MIHLKNQYKLRLFYALRNIHNFTVIKQFVRHGLKPLRIKKVPTDKLRIIRPVLCNEVDSNRIELFPWFENYFKNDWSVKNSMLYKFLKDYCDKNVSSPGIRIGFKKHDYFQMHTYFRTFRTGIKSDEWIGLFKVTKRGAKELQDVLRDLSKRNAFKNSFIKN